MTQQPPQKPKTANKLSFEAVVEEQIQEAYAEGQFDHLPGFGQPIAGLDEPQDEDWWLKDKLRREEISILPPGLEILRDVERTLERVMRLADERAVRRELTALNERIRDANFRHVSGPPSTQMPLAIDAVVTRWRAGQR